MIREVLVSDAAAIASIYNYYILHTVITFEEQVVAVDDMAERIRQSKSSGLPWLVAKEGDEVIGYAYASKWKGRCAYRFAVEVTVYLSVKATANGWGTKLYEALFAALKQGAFHTVIGGIALPNEASIALHEKFGMQQVAHFKEVGFKFEEWIDVGYWQGQLNG